MPYGNVRQTVAYTIDFIILNRNTYTLGLPVGVLCVALCWTGNHLRFTTPLSHLLFLAPQIRNCFIFSCRLAMSLNLFYTVAHSRENSAH